MIDTPKRNPVTPEVRQPAVDEQILRGVFDGLATALKLREQAGMPQAAPPDEIREHMDEDSRKLLEKAADVKDKALPECPPELKIAYASNLYMIRFITRGFLTVDFIKHTDLAGHQLAYQYTVEGEEKHRALGGTPPADKKRP